MIKKGLTVALICVFVAGALIFTGCRPHSGHGKAEFMVDYIAETLDLTGPQREHLDGIKEEFITKARAMHTDRQAMHDEFMTELRKEVIDEQRMKELLNQKHEKMAEVMDLAVTRLAEFHKTLSPEQREKLVEKIEWFHKKHDHRWE